MTQKSQAHNQSNKYRKRKAWFWLIFCFAILAVSGILFYYTSTESEKSANIISVGICGAVKHPAVYHIAEGSDLGLLIRHANGLNYCADIRKTDLNKVVLNDSVYHIPCRQVMPGSSASLETTLAKAIASHPDSKTPEMKFPDKEIKKITVLYVGFPALYMLINYYPDQKRVSIVHLPHSTILLNNDYRLIDIFFMIGIRPTISILENCLQQRIDYYIIQDRFSFINLVNLLDGIDLPLDKAFSEAYDLKTGNYHADGFYTWEYIRFLDIKRMNRVLSKVPASDLVRNDNFTVPPKNLQLAYELRQYRQRIVMNALRNSYSKISPSGQLDIIRKISKTFETDISTELVMSIYSDILSSPKFSFATLPGYYSDETEKLYYYPDIPGFRLMRNQEIRNLLGIRTDKSQTIY